MGFLREIFGPSKEEVWRQLAQELGGDFKDGGFLGKDKVAVKVKEWTITLDSYTVSSGKHSTTYTRMRAPYVNPSGFRFTIYRRHIFSPIGKLLGLQDIEIGAPDFDEAFIIKSNDEAKIRGLLSFGKLRELIEQQPQIYLSVKDDEGWFGADFPEGVDELLFRVTGVIKDPERLKGLYLLFAATLNFLCHIGAAYEDDPEVQL